MSDLSRALTVTVTLTAGAVALSVAMAARASAAVQPVVEVADVPIACWPTDAHRFVETTFVPPADALTLKFYFRSITEPDFHFVEATTDRRGRAVAILPIAQPETTQVVFFAELVTRSYVAYRTNARTIPAMSQSDCSERDPEAAWYQGQNADITVGATRPGAPMPNGFRPDGISRLLEVTGGAASSDGSNMPLILAGVGGATAATAFAAAGGGEGEGENDTGPIGGGGMTTTTSPPTTSVGGAPTTTVTTTTGGGTPTPTTTSLPGPTTSSTSGPTTTAPGTTTSAPGTTTSAPGTTTSSPGTTTSSPSSTTSAPGTTTSTPTTSSTPTTTTGTPPTTSTPTTSTPSGADISLSLSSSAPIMSGASWFFSINGTVTNNGPAQATGVLVTINVAGGLVTIGNNAGCGTGGTLVCVIGNIASGSSRTFRVDFRADAPGSYTNNGIASLNESDPSSGNNSRNVTTVISPLRASKNAAAVVLSRLMSDDAQGTVRLNREPMLIAPSGEGRLALLLRPGRNEIAAHVDSVHDGRWRFDFGGTQGFVPGSLIVEVGTALAADGYSVLFRIHPGVNEFRFAFDAEPATALR